MSGIAAAPWWATRWPTCCRRRGTTSPRSSTSTTPATRSPAPPWAAYWRYLQALGTTVTEEAFAASMPGGLQYRGDYLVPIGEALAARFSDSLAGPGLGAADPALWFDTIRAFATDAMLASIREDLAALGVGFDRFSSGARVAGVRRPGRHDREAPGGRAVVSWHAGAAEGQAADDWRRGAAAVPFHPVRRRRGPAAAQIRRQQHVFRQRHRLPRRQGRPVGPADRRAGGRPRRLRLPHEGGDGGGHRRRGDVGGRAVPDRAGDEGRRAGADEQAGPAPSSPLADLLAFVGGTRCGSPC